ncbi:MAG: hypothetical protein HRT72_06795, partial [Flavobacteriales bacterium]|nr:hypothetical protein [Flavobacteriales bacterium]
MRIDSHIAKLIKTTLLVLIFPILTYGQNISVTATLDTNTILIGDQINLSVQISHPNEYVVIWPTFIDTITQNILVVEEYKIDSSFSNNIITETISYLIT